MYLNTFQSNWPQIWHMHAYGCLLLHKVVLDYNPLLVHDDCVLVLDDELQVLDNRFLVLDDSGKG